MPKLIPEDKVYAAVPRRVFANAHAYHINSISINSDDEVFLSADDLRINLWNMQNNKETFMMVDIKPTNMEELTEVITGACPSLASLASRFPFATCARVCSCATFCSPRMVKMSFCGQSPRLPGLPLAHALSAKGCL